MITVLLSTVDLTNKLKVRPEDRKHLEKHEIDLIHALLNSYLTVCLPWTNNFFLYFDFVRLNWHGA